MQCFGHPLPVPLALHAKAYNSVWCADYYKCVQGRDHIMKRLAALTFSIVFLVGIGGHVYGAPIGFGVEGDGSSDVLFSVDLDTGLATNIGTGLGA